LETSLYVETPERSARWYETIFGFEVVARSDRLWALGVAGRQLLLLFKKGASTDHDGSGELHLAFSIAASDLDSWEQWLAENGVAVESRKTWEYGGCSLYFRDPDRHLLELATPGVWSIY